jgi:glycosyltransferase involved in cell wall biosynthesis
MIPRALISSPVLPEFDRESGSRRIFHLIEFLQDAGYAVSFATDHANGDQRYVRILQQRGVSVYRGYDVHSAALFKFGQLDIAIFAFWFHAEAHIEALRNASPKTRLIVDAIDLHWLREARRCFVEDPADSTVKGLGSDFASEIVRELNTYAAADAVLTVSEKEASLVNDVLGDRGAAYAVPDYEVARPSSLPFEDRKGIVFVGNFNHPPNVDAVEFLYDEVLPLIDTDILKEHPIYIVGNAPPRSVLRYGDESPYVEVVGWVPSVNVYLQKALMSVVPVRYGAGTKRKLLQTYMAGTPAVSTSIGVEGLNLRHGREALVADDAAGLARSIKRLARDKAVWERLVRRGGDQIASVHGREAVRARLHDALASTRRKPSAGMGKVELFQRSNGGETRREQTERIRQIVPKVVPASARVMVVSRGDPELVELPGREGWHFPRTPDGSYAGHYPGTSAEAIAHLEELRSIGGEYILFPASSFWWLGYYAEFADHLTKRYQRVWSDEASVIYRLSPAG